MKINFNRNFKLSAAARKRIALLVTFTLIIGAAFFLFATVPAAVNAQATATATATATTAPTNTPTPTALATGLPNPQGAGFLQYLRCGSYGFGQITPGACLQIYNGSDIEGFSAAGRRTYYMDAETGNITAYGSVIQGPSALKCAYGSQSVTGSATVIAATPAAAGITTPVFVIHSLAEDSTGAKHHTSSTNASGVVTLKVWDSALTPAASGSAAVVNYTVCGQ